MYHLCFVGLPEEEVVSIVSTTHHSILQSYRSLALLI